MNAFPAFILSGIIAAMAVPASAQAAESKVTYPAFNDGSHIHGPKLKASDLKGKVVFFEYWGINCPPCIASMPHLQELQENKVELVVLAGFLVAIPPMIVEAYPNRIINIHPSLIPSFCGVGFYGLHVHEGVLARGVKVSGATVHFVDTGTDTGPIILQKAVEVQQGDTPEVLQRRVMEEAEWKILPKAIDLIANNRVSVQNGKVVID